MVAYMKNYSRLIPGARALVADDDGGGGNGRRNIGKSCGNMVIGKSTLGVARCAVY